MSWFQRLCGAVVLLTLGLAAAVVFLPPPALRPQVFAEIGGNLFNAPAWAVDTSDPWDGDDPVLTVPATGPGMCRVDARGLTFEASLTPSRPVSETVCNTSPVNGVTCCYDPASGTMTCTAPIVCAMPCLLPRPCPVPPLPPIVKGRCRKLHDPKCIAAGYPKRCNGVLLP